MQLAWLLDMTGEKTDTMNINQWENAAVPGGTVNENTTIANVEQTAKQTTVTLAKVAIRKTMSVEAQDDTTIEIVSSLLSQSIAAFMQRVDSDVYANITSATNASSFAGAAFDLAAWGSAQTAFWALEPPGERPTFVGHLDQLRDLKASARATTGAMFGSAAHAPAASEILNAGRSGFVTNFEGMAIYQSGNIPAFDGSNWSGVMMMTGEGGALGLAFKRRSQMFLPQDAQLFFTTKFDEKIEDDDAQMVTTARYADLITSQDLLLEVISQT
jgi:hypothetical protein